MTFLVDTSVLSYLAPRRDVPPAVARWIETRSAELFLSVVTLAEIEQGIAKLSHERETHRALELRRWLDDTAERFDRRIIAIDSQLARAIGRLSGRAKAIGRHPGFADVAIAGTAQARRYIVLTRNRRHFEPLDVETIDPFEDALP